MTDQIEELLQEAQKQFGSLPVERTNKCPSDMNLHMLCFEEREDGPLKNKYMRHIMLCPYCSHYVLGVIRNKIKSRHPISKFKKILYPLFEEIDWSNINIMELFKDNASISKKDNIGGLKEVYFEINDPGYYDIRIDSGQIIWKREISEDEITLTDDEYNKAMEYGMAAVSSDEEIPVIVGFKEYYWDNKLKVELIKRRRRAKLVFKFTP